MARRLTIPELSPISDIKETGALLVRQDGRDRYISYQNLIVDVSDTLKSNYNDSWNAQLLDGIPIDVEVPQEGEVIVYRTQSNRFENQLLKANDLDWSELSVNEFKFLRLDANGNVTHDFVSVNSLVAGDGNSANRFLRVDPNSQNVVAVTFDPNEFTINAQYLEGQSLSDLDVRYLNSASNLSDLTNKASARASLEVYSKSESDSRYVSKSANLNDLASKSTAFNNIKQNATQSYAGVVELATSTEVGSGARDDVATTPKGIKDNYYSKQESNNIYASKSANLSDLSNKVVARNNLDVFSRTESDQRYLTAGLNLSDLTNKSLGRSNLGVYSTDEVDTLLSGFNSVPVGAIMLFPVSNVPDGWFKCNGASLSKTTYSELYDVIGGTYGQTSTTFRLPDLRGEFVRGWDDGRGVDPGRSIGSVQLDAFKSHNHSGSTNEGGEHTHGYKVPKWTDPTGPIDAGSQFSMTGNATTTEDGAHSHTFTTDSAGGSETRPRNVALMFCIKY